MSSLVMVVDDEEDLVATLEFNLRREGYATRSAFNGDAALRLTSEDPVPDLILLDLMLPGQDGLELCRKIRTFSAVPIIMVTARIEEVDRLLGLELGADDYICKPFSPREVVARVKAVLRRLQPPASASAEHLLTLDPSCFRIRAGGRETELTAVEFELLQALYRQPGRILSRQQLMDLIYPDQRIVSDRTIDSHIKKLRKKLNGLLPGREVIQSVYGAGYRYDPLD